MIDEVRIKYFEKIADSAIKNKIDFFVSGLPLKLDKKYYDNINLQLEFKRSNGCDALGYLVLDNIYYIDNSWKTLICFRENQVVYTKWYDLCELYNLNTDLVDIDEYMKIKKKNKIIFAALKNIYKKLAVYS
jgi:hypothetical protein